MAFDCATAPDLLGHPGATVVKCEQVAQTTNLWFVWLTIPNAGAIQRLVLTTDGPPFVGTGLAAMERYLVESDLDRQNVGLDDFRWYLKAADGYPPGWPERDRAGSVPGVGEVSLTNNPLVFTMYRRIPLPQSRGPGGRRPNEAPLVERAVLQKSAGGGFEWTMSMQVDRGWEEERRVPLK